MANTQQTTNPSTGRDAMPQKLGGISIRVLYIIMVAIVVAVSVVFLLGVQSIQAAYDDLEEATAHYLVCESAANELREASADLTSAVRAYVVTQDGDYLHDYYNEVLVDKRREDAIEVISQNYVNENTFMYPQRALENSNELMEREQHAILLVASAEGHDLAPYAEPLAGMALTPEEEALSNAEKIERATELVYDDNYASYVETIMGNVKLCKESLVNGLGRVQAESSGTMRSLLLRQQVITWALLAVVIVIIGLFIALVLSPLRRYIVCVRENEPLPGTGATELRALSRAYNIMYEENLKNHAALRKEAEHDFLTGLLNRAVFERLLKAFHDESYALLLIDADYFKEINDELGHDGGDAMLRKIARVLTHAFRTTDYPCRIGGDEFAVIMADMREDLGYVIEGKLRSVSEQLRDTSDGMPEMTLSVGIAFNDGAIDAERIFKNADEALYRAKEAGRDGYAFYDGNKTRRKSNSNDPFTPSVGKLR